MTPNPSRDIHAILYPRHRHALSANVGINRTMVDVHFDRNEAVGIEAKVLDSRPGHDVLTLSAAADPARDPSDGGTCVRQATMYLSAEQARRAIVALGEALAEMEADQ